MNIEIGQILSLSSERCHLKSQQLSSKTRKPLHINIPNIPAVKSFQKYNHIGIKYQSWSSHDGFMLL
ncbi:hypothetical protein PR048_021203 [Dryococelus australis]|uniref:Uncharacterized protein n=1 Tax=Dryococelus australis TaxID=614101 RepID=A0ABQ9GXQ5_9NEOP|nr:hypothetical protein PR048_021203 [Dryococelus australis]